MAPRDITSLSTAFRYTGVGMLFMGEAGAMTALGWWLDRRLGWTPWLMVVGVLLGVTLATIDLVRTITRLENAKQNDRTAGRRDS